MQSWKCGVVILVFLLLLSGMASAEELRIITKGTGYGMVIGEDLLCPDLCKQTYERGTIVHLKADAFSDSRFVGWLVDGEPHEGVIAIENDTVVTAIFELLTGLDDLTVYWYNGSVKQQAFIATDEMVVFLKERDQWGVTTEEEYQAAVQEILHQFHPMADIVSQGTTILILKSPEPLSKEQWFGALTSLKAFEAVRYTGPMLYRNLETRRSHLMPIGEISVRFPTNYTEEQIQAIEQEYKLVLKKVLPLGSKTSYYYYAGDPLESISTANRLYESGKVESAIPSLAEPLFPTAIPNDEYFAKSPPPYYTASQWHLHNPAYSGEDIHVLDAWDVENKSGTPIRRCCCSA